MLIEKFSSAFKKWSSKQWSESCVHYPQFKYCKIKLMQKNLGS